MFFSLLSVCLFPSLTVWQSHSCRVNWLKLNYAATSNVVKQQRPLDMRCPLSSVSLSPISILSPVISTPALPPAAYDSLNGVSKLLWHTHLPVYIYTPTHNTWVPLWDHPQSALLPLLPYLTLTSSFFTWSPLCSAYTNFTLLPINLNLLYHPPTLTTPILNPDWLPLNPLKTPSSSPTSAGNYLV